MAQKRQKRYNYTERHDKVSKNVELMKEGKVSFDSPKSLLEASGYTEKSAISTLANKDRNVAIRDILAEVWPIKEVIGDIKRIGEAAEASEEYGHALKARDMRLKMGGDYAAVKQEMEVKGTVEHKHDMTLGGQDYLEYKKKQISQREYINGEIIEETE